MEVAIVFVEVVIVFVLLCSYGLCPVSNSASEISTCPYPTSPNTPYHILSSNPFLIQVSEVIGMAVMLVVVLVGFQTFLYYFAKPAANFI